MVYKAGVSPLSLKAASMCLFTVFLVILGLCQAQVAPRNVKISGQRFVLAGSNETIVLSGPNVVVKGPPYLPSVLGDTYCDDIVNDECTATGTCKTCYTFNEADILHIKSKGWNAIRLGVTWAGAQPRDEDSLDPTFVKGLHDILTLTDKMNIHVILDNHGDMVGTAGCGNGVPVWFQQKAAPELIGKPLSTGFPFSLVPSLQIEALDGYSVCGNDESKWAEHAGDPNYNLLNQCCQAMNSPNPGALGYTKISQKTMDYMLQEGDGRNAFVRYWSLLAKEVTQHPSAVAMELDNEPMSIRRGAMYDTWRATAEAINAIIPDMSVSICDTGDGTLMPAFITEHFVGAAELDIRPETEAFIKESKTLFYAWHYYGSPSTPEAAVKNALAKGEEWDVPTFATEFMDCGAWTAAANAQISHSYWHYSSYCNTGPSFANNADHDDFGACILGWAGGNSNYKC